MEFHRTPKEAVLARIFGHSRTGFKGLAIELKAISPLPAFPVSDSPSWEL